MLQYMYEHKIGIALVSEPNRIPGGNWIGDAGGLAEVHWDKEEPCALVRRGEGYVSVECGEYILVSVYCSPNVEKKVFVKVLEDIGNCIGNFKGDKVIIGEDLNARSKLWDRKYNNRGFILEEWVDSKGLVVLNDGEKETCARAQGSSMVDVTIGTERAAREIREWKVDSEVKTLSDHKYISFKTADREIGKGRPRGKYSPDGTVRNVTGIGTRHRLLVVIGRIDNELVT